MKQQLLNIMSNRKLVSVIVLAVAVFIAYFPLLQSESINWADSQVSNLESSSTLVSSRDAVVFSKGMIQGVFSPLAQLTHTLEHQLFGFNSFYYYLNNILLHITTSVLVFFIVQKLGLSLFVSFATALLFAINPTKIESIAWMTLRKDLLAACLFMATIMYFLTLIKGVNANKFKFSKFNILILSFLNIACVLASPVAASIPFVLLLLCWLFNHDVKKTIIALIPSLIGIICVASITVSANTFQFNPNILYWIWSCIFYVRQMILPVLNVPIYQVPLDLSFGNLEVLFSFVFFVGSVVLGAVYRRNKPIVFPVYFYFLTILPALILNAMHEQDGFSLHYGFIASFAVCLIMGLLIEKCHKCFVDKNKNVGLVFNIVLLALVVAYGCKAHVTSSIWKSSKTLWQHQINHEPNASYQAYSLLAESLVDDKGTQSAINTYRKMEALKKEGLDLSLSKLKLDEYGKIIELKQLYQRSIQMNPDHLQGYLYLANLQKQLDESDLALENYKKVLSLKETHPMALFSAAEIYYKNEGFLEAAKYYSQYLNFYKNDQKAISALILNIKDLPKANSNDALKPIIKSAFEYLTMNLKDSTQKKDSLFNLGYLYYHLGDYKRSLSAYLMVLEEDPNHIQALYNLADLYREGGEFKSAISSYQRVIGLEPANSNAYLNMGLIYEKLGDLKQAKDQYYKAIKVNSKNDRAHLNIALMKHRDGDLDGAIRFYEQSLEHNDSNVLVLNNLGTIYVEKSDFKEAKKWFLSAVGKDPNYLNSWVNLMRISIQTDDHRGAARYLEEAILLGYEPPAQVIKYLESKLNRQ